MISEIEELTEELTELGSQLDSNPVLSNVMKTVSQISDSLSEEKTAVSNAASQNIVLKLIELKKKLEEVKEYQMKHTSQLQEMKLQLWELEEKNKLFEKKKEKLDISKQLLLSQMSNKKKKSNDLHRKIETDLLQMVKSLELSKEDPSLRAKIVDRLHDWSDGLGYASFTEFLSYLDPTLKERVASNFKEKKTPTKLRSPGRNKTRETVSKIDLKEEGKNEDADDSSPVSQHATESANEEASKKIEQTSVKEDVKIPVDEIEAQELEEEKPKTGPLSETDCECQTVQKKDPESEDKKPKDTESRRDDNEEVRRYVALENALKDRKKAVPCNKPCSQHRVAEFFPKAVGESNEAVLEILTTLKLEEETISLRKNVASKIMFWGTAANNSLLVDLLLRKTPEAIETKSSNRVTPLHIAALENHTKIVKVLIKRGVNINETNFLKSCAIGIAIAKGNLPVVKILLKAGVDINTQDVMGKSPMHFAADGNDYGHPKIHRLEALELLLKAGANTELMDESGATPLILAVFTNNAEAVRILLRAGANKNAQDNMGHTALHFAVRDSQTNIFKILLEAKVDLEIEDFEGSTALHVAALRDRGEFIVQLLQAGANPKAKTKKGHTPAQCAKKFSTKALFQNKL